MMETFKDIRHTLKKNYEQVSTIFIWMANMLYFHVFIHISDCFKGLNTLLPMLQVWKEIQETEHQWLV